MTWLPRVTGLNLRDGVRGLDIQEELGVELLLLKENQEEPVEAV